MALDSSTRSAAPASGPRWRALLVVLALLLATVAGSLARGTAAPVADSAPATDFSAARAAAVVAPVVARPRPIGSPETAAARSYLSEQLEAAGFDVAEQEGIGLLLGSGDYAGEATAGFVHNLVATRPGTDPTGTIVLATHVDSVPAAPGAADAGVGLAVIMETVRALGPDAARNDLVVLLVDGEEDGLLGSREYLQQSAGDLTEPVVVINHEARGTSGRPMVTRWSGPMQSAMSAMPSPEAESFTDALFGIIPNDTDFTEYRAAGWWGMDIAITDDSWAYHSPQDDAAHLDASTLQHYGEMTLSMSRDLLARDLAALDETAADSVLTTAPGGIIAVPVWLLLALAVLAPLAAGVGIAVAARRGLAGWGRSLLGVLGSVLTLLVGAALAIGAWTLAASVQPGMLSVVMGEPVVAWPFLAAEVAAAVAAMALVWALLRRRLGTPALALGATLTVTLLAAAVTGYSPQLGGWLLLPVAIAALATPIALALARGHADGTSGGRLAAATAVRVVAVVPMGWVLGAQLSANGEFGIASSNGMLVVAVLLSLLAVAGLVGADGAVPPPSLPAARSRRTALIPVTAVVAVVALVAGGLALQGSSGEPTQERVVAEVDAEDGSTLWSVTGSTAWGRGLDGSTAAGAELAPPECVVSRAGDGRVTVTVSSPRDSQRLTLALAEGEMTDVVVDGVALPAEGEELTTVRLLGLQPGQSAVVELSTAATSLTCTDETHDPTQVPGWQAPPDDVSLVQPAVRVSATVPLG